MILNFDRSCSLKHCPVPNDSIISRVSSRLCIILSNFLPFVSFVSFFSFFFFFYENDTFRNVFLNYTRTNDCNVAVQEYRKKTIVFRVERRNEKNFSFEPVRWKPSRQVVQIFEII